MKSIFNKGDKKTFERKVRPEDIATFDSSNVHPVYATFAIARDAEWSSRLFVLEIKDDDEEGIGNFVHVNHISPALEGDIVLFESFIDELVDNALNCSFIAKVNGRVIAEGKTGQKILKKEKIERLLDNLKFK
ncbi:MAG: hypothetical protein IPP77_05595 [Bacteroidetes bacterium]|nr:hypothetical protein [Bacteroidota bacterium]